MKDRTPSLQGALKLVWETDVYSAVGKCHDIDVHHMLCCGTTKEEAPLTYSGNWLGVE